MYGAVGGPRRPPFCRNHTRPRLHPAPLLHLALRALISASQAAAAAAPLRRAIAAAAELAYAALLASGAILPSHELRLDVAHPPRCFFAEVRAESAVHVAPAHSTARRSSRPCQRAHPTTPSPPLSLAAASPRLRGSILALLTRRRGLVRLAAVEQRPRIRHARRCAILAALSPPLVTSMGAARNGEHDSADLAAGDLTDGERSPVKPLGLGLGRRVG